MSVDFAPYDEYGNMIDWLFNSDPTADHWSRYGGPIEKRPNEPFRAKLYYKTWERGRSAVRIIWEDSEGHTYPMFIKDMDALLSGGEIFVTTRILADNKLKVVNAVHGTWHAVKRGASFGIALVAS